MFSKYFQSELAYLREVGRSFSAANPAMAGMLAERGGDPDVERLLEGFSFLTARIRERIDDAVPEIAEALCELLLPHYLRPIPACAIVEFMPASGTLRARQRVAKGAEVGAVPVDGTTCRFRTTTDVDLLPLTITEVDLDRTSAVNPVFRVQFQATSQAKGEAFQPGGIRLYVHHEPPVASMVILWLARFCKRVIVRSLGKQGEVTLPPECIRLSGFDPEDVLLPWPRFAPEGYRLIQEYFTLPQKFLFFEIRDLDQAAAVADEKFEIAFVLERPPEIAARFNRESLRLHCSPVVNLFQIPADPIQQGPFAEEQIVRAAEMDPLHAEVYEIRTVTGVPAGGRGERREYRPFHDFSHALDGSDEQAYYRVRRARSPIDEGVDTFLTVLAPREGDAQAEDQVLSIELTCTNRSLPAQLRVGDISAPTVLSPTIARFRNLSAVTRPVRPPIGSELLWRLVSHMGLNRLSLTDVSVLRSVLDLYNFQAVADQVLGRVNRLRVEAIRSVTSRPEKLLLDGAPVRGVHMLVEVDEKNYASEGDAFLFGCVLEDFISSHVTINSFSRLTLKLHPSQAEFSWPAKNCRRPIL